MKKQYVAPTQHVENIDEEDLLCGSGDHGHGHGHGWDKDGDGEKDHGGGWGPMKPHNVWNEDD